MLRTSTNGYHSCRSILTEETAIELSFLTSGGLVKHTYQPDIFPELVAELKFVNLSP